MAKRDKTTTSSLAVRKTVDGEIRIEGDAPDDHVFVGSWIARMVAAGDADVRLTVAGHEYALTGFELRDPDNPDSGPNYAAWTMSLVKGA